MVRVKWGGDELQERLENYDHERDDQYRPYEGPKPPPGMYGWRVTRMLKDKTTNGFPQIKVSLALDPRDQPHARSFAGFRMMDFIVVKEDGSTDFRIAPLLRAMGISVKDFLTRTNSDDGGVITSIGRTTIGDNFVMGSIRPNKNDPTYFEIKYWPPSDNVQPDDDPVDDADADPDADNADKGPARSTGRTTTRKAPF